MKLCKIRMVWNQDAYGRLSM